jgi:outer membrane protein assembly factor BamB
MKKHLLVIGIIVLFIGTGVFPVTGIITDNENIIKNQTKVESESRNSATSGGKWWPMFHHDVQLTGYTTSPSPSTNKVSWTVGSYTNEWDDPQRSAPAIVSNKLYVGAVETSFDPKIISVYPGIKLFENHFLSRISPLDSVKVISPLIWSEAMVKCVDVETGEELWETILPDKYFIRGSAAYSEGRVYITATNAYYNEYADLYCLDALTGDILWNVSMDQWDYTSQVVLNGKVYVAGMVVYEWPTSDCILYCLDAETGTEIYNSTLGSGSPVDSLAFYNDLIYISVFDRVLEKTYLYCAYASNGSVIWYKDLLGNFKGSSPVIYNDMVIVTSMFDSGGVECDGILWCLDATTGDELWNFTTDNKGNCWSTPAVAYGNIYMTASTIWIPPETDGKGEMFCLNSLNGDIIWNRTLGDWLYSSPAVANEKIYINSINYWNGHGYIHCLDALDGSIDWQYWLVTGSYSSPAVANGTLYIAAPLFLYALDDSAPASNPPQISISGPKEIKLGELYNFTIVAVDPEGSDLFMVIECSNDMPGGEWGEQASGESYKFRWGWYEKADEYFIRARAQDDHHVWSEWEYFKVKASKDKTVSNYHLLLLCLLQRFPLLQKLIQQPWFGL